jgi:uncharacterized protein
MTNRMADFPDVNVWVALTAEDHVHHERAKVYWHNEANTRLAFCRTTAMGLVRVTSHQHTFGGRPLATEEAWNSYLLWRSQPEIELLHEPSGIEDMMTDWCRKGLATTRNWTDLYLAAFARAGGLRLVTFDSGFRRFPGVELLHLQP